MPDSKPPENESAGQVDYLEMAKKRLEEMGLSEDDIGMVVEGAGGIHSEGGRWRICPQCKANIDMMTVVKGEIDGLEWPRILPTGCVECPNCGCSGERMGLNAMHEPHPKLKTYQAKVMSRQFPWAVNQVREAVTIIEEIGLFPSDPIIDSPEPHWPRDLAACILGASMMILSTIKRQVDRFDPDSLKSRVKVSSRPWHKHGHGPGSDDPGRKQ